MRRERISAMNNEDYSDEMGLLMSEWKDISDAPRDGSQILVCYKFREQQEQYVSQAVVSLDISHDVWEITYDCSIPESAIIGWMPLPNPPKKKHRCVDSERKEWCCRDYPENKFQLRHGGYWILVSYCPFCGEQATKNHE